MITISSSAPDQTKTLFLIDGSGFIFRSFHALPPLTRKDGTPINAVFGFMKLLMTLTDTKATAMAVMFDSQGPTFRHRLDANYKANRSAPPPELVPQFALIHDSVKAFNIPTFMLEGYEADDLIATYTRLGYEAGYRVTILSSDKDFMQLVRDRVTIHDPIKNRSIERNEVIMHFGVQPQQVIDVQALAGDPVDNIRGVPGIGPKTAAELINRYGTLEALFDHVAEISQPKRRQILIDNIEQAYLARRLARLDDHVAVPSTLDDLVWQAPNPDHLLRFLSEQGFRTIISRLVQKNILPDTQNVSSSHIHKDDKDDTSDTIGKEESTATGSYTLIQTVDVLLEWIEHAYDVGIIAVDTETDSLHPQSTKLVGISLAIEPGYACYIPLGHRASMTFDFTQGNESLTQLSVEPTLALLKPLLEDRSILKIGHNLKFDAQVFKQFGITLGPIDDTMLMSYVLEGTNHSHKMDTLASLYLDIKTITYEEVVEDKKKRRFDEVSLTKACTYAAQDADITLRLYHVFKSQLIKKRLLTVYETIERPLVSIVADMEYRGILVDTKILNRLSYEFSLRLKSLEDDIYRLAGRSFNVGSPKQLSMVLFDELDLVPEGQKSKTGLHSTNSHVLESLADQGVEIAARILEWRTLSKLRSTYTEVLQHKIDPITQRIHTSFSLAHVSTGRLASSDPNLQNIPIRTEEGRQIRTAFIAQPGWRLLSVDYSQIELRIIAEMAQIKALKQAFQEGVDVHTLTARQIFGLSQTEVTKEHRRQAKAINFGILYGLSSYGLAKQLDIPTSQAQDFIKEYLECYHELKSWIDRTTEFCRHNGFVVTYFGRRCYVPDINHSNAARRRAAERQTINAPIQGTAADIIKRAMGRMSTALRRARLRAQIVLQVHDELLFEVPIEESDHTVVVTRHIMENAARFDIPLTVEDRVGPTWAEAH